MLSYNVMTMYQNYQSLGTPVGLVSVLSKEPFNLTIEFSFCLLSFEIVSDACLLFISLFLVLCGLFICFLDYMS